MGATTAIRGLGARCLAEIFSDLGRRHLGIHDRQLGPFLQQIAADANRWRFAGVVRVGLESKAQHRQALAGDGAKQLGHHQPGNAVLLPGVERHHLLPVGRHLLEAVVAAEIHQIEDVFLEAAAAKARARLQKFGANAAVRADGLGHLAHIGARGLAKGGNAVDRADPLGQKGIGRELGELAAPQVRAQDLLRRYPVAVDPS